VAYYKHTNYTGRAMLCPYIVAYYKHNWLDVTPLVRAERCSAPTSWLTTNTIGDW